MTTTTAGIVFLAVLIIALAVVHVPLGDYMYRVYSTEKHSRVERAIYRLIGADPKAEQTWGTYARSVLAFSAVSILFLFTLQLVQGKLPLHLNDPDTPMTPALAWNTAVSFVTNTNWQAYSGESTHSHLVQMAGLAVQNFVSAAVGMAVAIALVRGFARRHTGDLGNFWVDLVRGSLRILLPVCVVAAIALIVGGAVQNFHNYDQVVDTLAGAKQTIPGGPVASQEAIKDLGTNGGGFYNVNSAHPFENPATWTNWIEIFLLLVIAFSLPRTFGRMVGSAKQGYAIVAVQATIALISWSATMWFQLQAHGTVPTAVGAAMEGVEQRFGVANSAVFAASTTLTSTGSVDSFHDSYTSLGGLVLLLNMQLGEVAPGGVGAGLYGILILAIITVFVAGLMVGRTPEYLGKKITPREIKLAASYFLVTPLLVLTGTAAAMAMPGQRAGMLNTGPHGLSEVLYAFTSASNNNGSAFAGLSVNTTWYDTALGLAMVFGRFLPIIFVLALAGSLARQGKAPDSVGTLPTHRPQFVGMVAGVTLILVALTFLPMLALGPLAEGIH
ncbi:K+-transporting ATPase subunit A [Mycolicibacterium sp. (ex Dasyatis americana)]|uniref:Potassium-transporting ATPase potassium-binding subunit n=1 Tax=Mycobacterium syngnathidarum TaxID=1908205 RepID=A0A1Q9W961_9MYCO|nr:MULTISPECIES: potassium-transporting ATPase subunit KdpA [Mycobacterium]OFB37775.1 K+-transporting ATPase subunit A [Mycolicibacterium sp. (ex Dasyatis americana)]MCG7609730.1 potassium-transporting ATPase subunit KdpA [Mycobacterium sp. CnD-18-1]OHU01309.1 potassium-transporting ATPase subunit A [Mycobacterium syngnathidarum]OLT95335.1 potassium-transporting ATPase subunit A [Mycobacterium syngnathidarum]TMS48569.1 potassium-transporting ATPase subunit KdpA [Mycobacterium sp. DBP42]